ncbi:mucin-associated surface protein (MASP), putative [Trypanosoma cruzi]|uniref:Mucin-associated surface protein (MASP), putative n=1 Tax=Trypanosoma cruzi (strain CL Brener) TaxID=353153 RepID=Q4DGD0_TRYCC|nr:mucin-associated surface protein (MASP), putative [Trypanosoma cruzi]EAN91573.1 mucin-associated surface protein (MASP), putative [Trypanosoma cruzi]|eukprot:XP_813424.1 mucin-associated surface protein (MASP) [Trypanosoma cruzi strain CL Brener]
MAMMMTGRVLLVCALCVLWCGLSGIAAYDADGADGSAVEYSLSRWRAQLRRGCAVEVSRRTGGGANASAVEECVGRGMDGVRAVVDGRSRWRRQQFAVAAAAVDGDVDSGEVDINSVSSPEDQSGTGAGSREESQVKPPVVSEPGQADTTPGGENPPKPAESLETAKGKSGGTSKEKDKEERPTVETKGPNSTDDNKQVDNAAIGNSNGGREEKNGVTLQVQDEVVKPKEEKQEPQKELEEKEKQKAQGNKKDDPEDPGEDAEDTEDSADGTDHKEGEGQKEGDAGSNKKGKELNGGGDTDGTPPDAPVVLQPAPPVEVTDPQSIEKTNDDDTGGKEDAGRTQTQEAAGPSQAENLTAELSTEENAAETETGTPGKKTQPEDAGKEQTTVGAKSNQETPAAEREAQNREEVIKDEEGSEKATTNENFDGRQTAVKDNAHNEAEKTSQKNENELDKAEETTAEVKEKEETTERKTVAAKGPNLNSTAATNDSDSSTAVSHTTSPLLLLLLVVACAAAAAVVAA